MTETYKESFKKKKDSKHSTSLFFFKKKNEEKPLEKCVCISISHRITKSIKK